MIARELAGIRKEYNALVDQLQKDGHSFSDRSKIGEAAKPKSKVRGWTALRAPPRLDLSVRHFSDSGQTGLLREYEHANKHLERAAALFVRMDRYYDSKTLRRPALEQARANVFTFLTTMQTPRSLESTVMALDELGKGGVNARTALHPDFRAALERIAEIRAEKTAALRRLGLRVSTGPLVARGLFRKPLAGWTPD